MCHLGKSVKYLIVWSKDPRWDPNFATICETKNKTNKEKSETINTLQSWNWLRQTLKFRYCPVFHNLTRKSIVGHLHFFTLLLLYKIVSFCCLCSCCQRQGRWETQGGRRFHLPGAANAATVQPQLIDLLWWSRHLSSSPGPQLHCNYITFVFLLSSSLSHIMYCFIKNPTLG